jgi:hypothetical protein
MESIPDLEKFINIDNCSSSMLQTCQKLNEINSNVGKISSKEFFKTFRSRQSILLISEYLTPLENLSLVFVNKLVYKSMQNLMFQESFIKMKQSIVNIYKGKSELSLVLSHNAKSIISLLYENKIANETQALVTKILIASCLNKHFFCEKNDKKQELDLSNCDLGYFGMQLAFFIIGKNDIFSSINLSNNFFSHSRLFEYFSLTIKKEKPWEKLFLENNTFFLKDEIKYFTGIFHLIPKLKILNLSKTNMNNFCCEILAEKIWVLKQLTSLSIDNNQIGQAVSKLLKALEKLKKLSFLSLKKTIKRENINQAMSEFLIISPVTRLVLSENKYHPQFFSEIQASLTKSKLNYLNLNECCLTSMLGKTILESFFRNKSIKIISLGNNNFDGGLCSTIEKLLKKNIYIENLSFTNNTRPYKLSQQHIKTETVIELVNVEVNKLIFDVEIKKIIRDFPKVKISF